MKKIFALSILSGIFIGTSYMPFYPWALAFCFVPLWWLWYHQPNLKTILISGWITQFILGLIGFNWIVHTIHEFGELPWIVGLAGLLLFACLAHIYIPLTGLVWFYTHKFLQKTTKSEFSFTGAVASVFFLFLLAALFEVHYPKIFEWNLAYPLLAEQIPIYHNAELIGFQGLSALVLLQNTFILLTAIALKNKCIMLLRPSATATVSLIIGLLITGTWLAYNQPEPDAKVKVLVAQANIGNSEKIQAETNLSSKKLTLHILEKFKNLSAPYIKQLAPSDFILWPETAIPMILTGNWSKDFIRGHSLFQYASQYNVHLITGHYGYSLEEERYANSLAFIDPQGRYSDQIYHKYSLLAFGEYIPFGSWFPVLYDWIPQVSHFHRGKRPTPRKIGDLLVGPQICYEGLFADLSIDLARNGSQIIINTTNDSWFGHWQEPYQHLYMTLARAIEVRRPLVRATNTGISAAMTAKGEILGLSPVHKEWAGIFEIPYEINPKLTIFTRFPYLTHLLLWGFLGLTLMRLFILHKAKRGSLSKHTNP